MTPRDEAIHSNLIFRRLKNTLGANTMTPVREATGPGASVHADARARRWRTLAGMLFVFS